MREIEESVDVIKGRKEIGIEMKKNKREMVYMSEMMERREFEKQKEKIEMEIGKKINGEKVIEDIEKMKKVMVEGKKGQGKQVEIKKMIMQLIYRMKKKE